MRKIEERAALMGLLSKLRSELLRSKEMLQVCAIYKKIENADSLSLTLKRFFQDTPYPLTSGQAESIVSEILKEV